MFSSRDACGICLSRAVRRGTAGMLNLLLNAIKAARGCGGRAPINVSADEEAVMVAVTNTGARQTTCPSAHPCGRRFYGAILPRPPSTGAGR